MAKRKSTIRKVRSYLALPPEDFRDLLRALNTAERAIRKVETIIEGQMVLSRKRKEAIRKEQER